MKISKSKIAIVIPSAGGKDTLDRCLKGIYQHTSVNYELCIVSQGELGAHNYLKSLLEKEIFKNKDSEGLYVHYNDENEPGSRGYNRGIKLAEEMFLILIICYSWTMISKYILRVG